MSRNMLSKIVQVISSPSRSGLSRYQKFLLIEIQKYEKNFKKVEIFEDKWHQTIIHKSHSYSYSKSIEIGHFSHHPGQGQIQMSPFKRFVSVRMQDTPNPNSLMFFPKGGKVTESSETIDFPDLESASNSPLAKRLFQIPGVKYVFFGRDFITITKVDDSEVEWNPLIAKVQETINEFYDPNGQFLQPIVTGTISKESNEQADDNDVIAQIKQLLDEKIRPTVQEDGGDCQFVSYEKGLLKLKMQGACTSCPSSINTLRNGVLNMMQFYIPEVTKVEQIIPDEEKIALSEFEKFEKKQEEKNLKNKDKKPKN